MDMRPITLDSLGGGVARELFDEELRKVMADIENVNTKPDEVRKITLTVSVKPSENRQTAQVTVNSKCSLAGTRPASTVFHFGTKGGAMVAYGSDPDQLKMAMDRPEVIEGRGGNG